MAAPVRRGETAPVAGLTTTSPAGTQIGDLVIVITFERLGAASGSTLTIHGSMGRELINHFHNDGSTDGALAAAAVIATSAGAQSYQGFTSSTGSPAAWTGCIVLQAGTFSLNLNDISSASVTATGTGVPNPPAVGSLNAAIDYFSVAVSAWHLSSATAFTPTAPSGFSNLVHVAASSTGELAIASRTTPDAVTSEDPGTFGDSVTPNGTCSLTILIPEPIHTSVSVPEVVHTYTSEVPDFTVVVPPEIPRLICQPMSPPRVWQ